MDTLLFFGVQGVFQFDCEMKSTSLAVWNDRMIPITAGALLYSTQSLRRVKEASPENERTHHSDLDWQYNVF